MVTCAKCGLLLSQLAEIISINFSFRFLFYFTSSFRCLHEWEPHDGEPVTSIFFCDNLLPSDNRSPFWRFLITGTKQNSILKIWCAVSWKCLQTIRFVFGYKTKAFKIFSQYVNMSFCGRSEEMFQICSAFRFEDPSGFLHKRKSLICMVVELQPQHLQP